MHRPNMPILLKVAVGSTKLNLMYKRITSYSNPTISGTGRRIMAQRRRRLRRLRRLRHTALYSAQYILQ